jgi:hypothetical protein
MEVAPTGIYRPIALARTAHALSWRVSIEKSARVAVCPPQNCFDRTDPHNPINRRVSVIVMMHQAELD